MTSKFARIPLAYPIGTRDTSLNKDPYIRNGMIEQYGDTFRVLKRPGTQTFASQPSPGGTAQGLTYYNGHYFEVVNDVLYRSSGSDPVKSDGTAWTQSTTPTWYGRSFLSATVFNGRIWVIGGEAGFNYADINYTTDGVTWAQNASGAPFGHRQGHQVVVLNDTMYLLGGFQNDSTTTAVKNDVWSTTDGANWTQVTAAAPWAARDNFGACVGNNGIYIYGGDLGGGTYADDVWFSVDGVNWTELTSTATGRARYLHSMVFFHSKVWIIGGADGAGDINATLSSPDGQTWTGYGPIWPSGRSLMAATIYQDKIWLIGGGSNVTGVDTDVFSSPDGANWTLVTSTPGWTARGGASAVTFQTPNSVSQFNYETMWLIGGNDGVSDLQQVWRSNLNVDSPTSYALNPDASGQPYQFSTYTNGIKLVLKNQSNLWVLAGGQLTKVTDPNYPTVTVPGLVSLGGFLFVMTPQAEIHNCEIDDPLTWPSLDFLTADYEDDPGICLAKHLNYVVALGQSTTQFFYDNGANQPVGSPLAPYQSANLKVGCANARTVINCGGTLYWVATSTSNARYVVRLNGVSPDPVSTFYVDRAIGTTVPFLVAFELGTVDGRSIYVLGNFSGSGVYFAFDTKFNEWYEWDNFPNLFFTTSFASGVYTGLNSSGDLVAISQTYYDDDGSPFSTTVQTLKNDYGNLFRKFWGRVSLVCDQATGNATIEATDDDYQNYTTLGTVDTSLTRPNLTRLGSSRRRAWRVTQADSNPSVRFEALEISYSQGESS